MWIYATLVVLTHQLLTTIRQWKQVDGMWIFKFSKYYRF